MRIVRHTISTTILARLNWLFAVVRRDINKLSNTVKIQSDICLV